MTQPLEFWFEFASTYSYPAAMRVEAACASQGVPLVWRPFLLGPVFAAQGLKDSPFNIYPIKGAYMWRDLERLCEAQGLDFKRPSDFPRGSLLAARVACAFSDAPWAGAFIRKVYDANFSRDLDVSQPQVIVDLLTDLEQDARAVVDAAQAPTNKDVLKALTKEAADRGVFGAPTMTVGEELFWGNDRLDAAIAWALRE
ncbi:MAG: 2-hydroxychromene-2-carboxylate isomerase [Pseudomonadota bacterium]